MNVDIVSFYIQVGEMFKQNVDVMWQFLYCVIELIWNSCHSGFA